LNPSTVLPIETYNLRGVPLILVLFLIVRLPCSIFIQLALPAQFIPLNLFGFYLTGMESVFVFYSIGVKPVLSFV
jgi:hypothetical protein